MTDSSLALDPQTSLEPRARLAPITRPPNLLSRLMTWFFRWKFGRVMSPLTVMFPRWPQMVRPHLGMLRLVQRRYVLDPLLVELIQLRSSVLNGCTFCADLHRAFAHEAHPDAASVARKKLGAIEDLADPVYTQAERAALQYVSEITQQRKVHDATFEELRRHFDERAIVQMTVVNAVINYTNLMAVPLGLESEGFCAVVDARNASR